MTHEFFATESNFKLQVWVA